MYQYRRKIRSDRARTFLWGSESIELTYKGGASLVIQVEDISEPITLYVVKSRPFQDNNVKIGILEPGEAYTLLLHGLQTVFAKVQSGQDGFVSCAIIPTIFEQS